MKNKISKINFLLIPPVLNNYYFRILDDLADALIDIGHNAHVVKNNVGLKFIEEYVYKHKTDVILQINAIRNNRLKLPDSVIFISWMQDLFTNEEEFINENIEDNNYILTLGSPEILGFTKPPKNYIGSFFTGVNNRSMAFYSSDISQSIDMSIVGFIPKYDYISRRINISLEVIRKLPHPLNLIYKKILSGSFSSQDHLIPYMSEIVQKNYTPLTGSLDIKLLEVLLREGHRIKETKFKFFNKTYTDCILPSESNHIFSALKYGDTFLQERAISYFTQTFPRYLDRIKLFEYASSFPAVLKVFGPGWDYYQSAMEKWGGQLNSTYDLWSTYKKTKINLANNTHGLGLHSRVLESMACGGLVATHKSKRDSQDGGFLSSFKEGEHFVYIDDRYLLELLKDDDARKKITKNAFEVIEASHTWLARARQLVQIVHSKMDISNEDFNFKRVS